MSKSTQVAKPQEAMPPAPFGDIGDDVKLGGAVSAADLSLPFLRILQGLSPQLNPRSPAYIKGAASGDIALTVLNRFWERQDGVDVVFCHYTRVFVEWRSRDSGGGLVNVYGPEDPALRNANRNERGQMFLPNGNEVIETAYHAVLVMVDGKWVQAVLPLQKTMLKASRKLNHLLTTMEISDGNGRLVQAPRWAKVFHMSTTDESRAGNTWSVPTFEPKDDKYVNMETYAIAKKWAIAANRSSNFAQSDAAQAPKNKVDDDLPF